MRELAAIFSPQWWTLKNSILRSQWNDYMKAIVITGMAAGFWVVALHYLTDILNRLKGMEGNVGNIIALKGLSLLLMLVFFLLIFSSLLTSLKSYYLAHDLPVLLASPVSWGNIFLSKWVESVIKSSWMITIAVLPVFIAFGIFFKAALSYYLVLFPALLLFVFIPAGIGIMIAIFIMAVIPANRAQNIFIVLGLLVLVLVMVLFRFLQPERFANPEWFANMTIFLSEMQVPVSVWLPSMWLTETLSPFMHLTGGRPLFYMLLLLFTAAVLVIFGSWLFNALYYNGLVKGQQAGRPWLLVSADEKKGSGVNALHAGLFRSIAWFFRGSSRAIIEKDYITFFRSVGQWSQMLLLFAIIVIYLFSIKALPVEWGTFLSVRLKYLISFLNIGLVGFIITAIASRLVLPQVNQEGPAFWIVRVSPVPMGRFIWSKFFFAFFPLLVLAQGLIITSNLLLGVTPWFVLLGIGTMVVLVASITGLAVGIGASSARFTSQDTGKGETGFHGTVFMLACLFVITATIVLEIIPMEGIFLREVSGASLTSRGWTLISALFCGVVLLNVLVLWLAMKRGEKRLRTLE
jgi:ABC-2 type transport system permease protein